MGETFRLVLSLSLAGSVMILALLALSPLLRRRLSRAWQYYLWLIVLLRLIVPYTPSLGIALPDGLLPAGGAALPAETAAASAPAQDPATPAVPTGLPAAWPQEPARTDAPTATAPIDPADDAALLDLPEILGGAWLTGAALTFLFRIGRYAAFTRKVRSGALAADRRRGPGPAAPDRRRAGA